MLRAWFRLESLFLFTMQVKFTDVISEQSPKLSSDFDQEYQLHESVWDATLWIGLASSWPSLITGLLMLMNIGVQAYFCYLISDHLGGISDMSLGDEDLDGFLSWRITAAHHVRHYDEVTNTSLATRVCGQWSAATASYDQMQVGYVSQRSLVFLFSVQLLPGSGRALCSGCLCASAARGVSEPSVSTSPSSPDVHKMTHPDVIALAQDRIVSGTGISQSSYILFTPWRSADRRSRYS